VSEKKSRILHKDCTNLHFNVTRLRFWFWYLFNTDISRAIETSGFHGIDLNLGECEEVQEGEVCCLKYRFETFI
jgi:hypothetical protein